MLNLPSSQATRWLLADWVEVRLLFGSETGALSVASVLDFLVEDGTATDLEVYDEVIEEELAVEDGPGVRRSLRSESAEGIDPQSLLAEETLEELAYRAQMVGPRYPITVSRTVARRSVASWREAPGTRSLSH